MTSGAELVKGYYVYQYTFLDDLKFMGTPETYMDSMSWAGVPQQEVGDWVDAVRARFLAAGWEGDGKIGVIWIPPFVDVGVEDTWGTYIWHVKQRNNGTSFLLSPYPLDFQRIREQNEKLPRGRASSIVGAAARVARDAAKDITSQLSGNLRSIAGLTDKDIATRIQRDLLAHAQGLLVRTLHEFLDDCYLKLLIEAISGGNRWKLKLRKSRVQLSPDRYLPDDMGDNYDADNWFTVRGVITDMWHAYKFEPYKAKLEMLFKAVDYSLDSGASAFLAKHVTLRNGLQHREGYLDQESLEQLGVKELKLRTATGHVVLTKGKGILFTAEEVADLGEALARLANEFDAHIWKRVLTREYEVRP